jgi:Flp pilus assembly protein TadG
MRTVLAHGKHCKGQALVEMAIILPLLLLLVLGIFEFGRAMYIKNTLTNAARAGARAAVVTYGISNSGQVAINPSCAYGDTPTGNNRVFVTICRSLYSGIDKTHVSSEITLTDANNNGISPDGGDLVKVRVTLSNYKPIVLNFIPGVPKTLSGDTAMRYE